MRRGSHLTPNKAAAPASHFLHPPRAFNALFHRSYLGYSLQGHAISSAFYIRSSLFLEDWLIRIVNVKTVASTSKLMNLEDILHTDVVVEHPSAGSGFSPPTSEVPGTKNRRPDADEGIVDNTVPKQFASANPGGSASRPVYWGTAPSRRSLPRVTQVRSTHFLTT